MFTQMRTFNLKIISAILFVTTFLVGGLFLNSKTEAATTVKSYGVSYSLSPIISTTNTDGSVTTRILVGCAPSSGDSFDINTGLPCTNVSTVLKTCAVGDIYDINTGIRCSDYIKPVLVGCGINGGDAYDINTGNKCKNNAVIATISKPNTIAKITPISSITPKLTSNTTKTTVTDTVLGISPLASSLLDTSTTEENTDTLSGREILKNNITASVQKAGAIITGPMSVSVILLIILILLGGGYGVYSFKKKDDIVEPETVKHGTVKPIAQAEVNKVSTQTAPTTPAKPATPEVPHVNTTPATPTPSQMPHTNIPQNTNPQISHMSASQTTTPSK